HVLPKVFVAKANERIARMVSPGRGGDDFAHRCRVGALELPHFLVIIVETGGAISNRMRVLLVAVKRGEIVDLDPGLRWFEREPVMKIFAAGAADAEFAVVGRAKALGIANRADVWRAADHAHFLVIPAERINLSPKTPVKMGVIHQQTLDAL